MNVHYRNDVLDAIEQINKRWNEPQCYLVALLLASQFQGEIWYNSNHCITNINGNFYDKNGMVTEMDIKNDPQKYLPLEMFGISIKKVLIEALIEKHK